MTAMNRLAGTAEAAAYAIKDVAETPFIARPYNRFESYSSLWWLVPSNEWPAFKFGKLFFDLSNLGTNKDASLHCGLCLEKGLSVELHRSMRHLWSWTGGGRGSHFLIPAPTFRVLKQRYASQLPRAILIQIGLGNSARQRPFSLQRSHSAQLRLSSKSGKAIAFMGAKLERMTPTRKSQFTSGKS
jgi:hypothetical protein